jgi:predicted enzyme related to lactoylglutathione lyase
MPAYHGVISHDEDCRDTGGHMPLNRIVLYVKDVEKTVAFYEKYFRFTASREEGDRIVELVGDQGGASLMIHPQAKARSPGRRW